MVSVDKSWSLRNADVLVQLLQCGALQNMQLSRFDSNNVVLDDSRELQTVKHALRDHVSLDPHGTIRVLMEQCNFPTNKIDTEEIGVKRKIRTLVLQFLSESWKKHVADVAKLREVDECLKVGLLGV